MLMFHLDSGYDMSDLFHHIISERAEEKKKNYHSNKNLVGSRSCIDIEYVFNYTINKDKKFKNFKKALF